LKGVSPTVPGTPRFQCYHMKKNTGTTHDEPVGIVISGGHPLSEAAPRFSAYIWAPGPEDERTEGAHAA